MKLTVEIPNLRHLLKDKRGVRLSMNEAKKISAMLEWFRNSKAGENYTFGTESIERMENVIDAQLFDGRVYYRGSLGLWIDKVFIPQEMRHGKWVNK
jgi:hypothetical protein